MPWRRHAPGVRIRRHVRNRETPTINSEIDREEILRQGRARQEANDHCTNVRHTAAEHCDRLTNLQPQSHATEQNP